jgi:prepilin-type N-terminal cleavage/methylation domain-containing protein
MKTDCKISIKSGAGFTLIEMLVAIFIFSTVTIAIITVFSNFFTSASKQNSLIASQDMARKLTFGIVNQLRNAQTGSDGSYAIDVAGDQEMAFHANIDGGASLERVRYYLQNGKLWEGITNYSNNTYNTSTEKSVLALDNVANSSSTPLFYYYDGNYIGSSTQSSLTQPVNVTQVKFVKINLQITNTGGLKGTNYYTVNDGAAVRNLKTNLGQ